MRDSEWIIGKNLKAFHLPANKESLAPLLLFVGDPHRVKRIDRNFDKIEYQATHREFVVSTGWIGKTRLSVIGTGIGTPNIDIVMNELEALFNLGADSKTRLTIIRLGTSGSLSNQVPVDSLLLSEKAIGMDGLLYTYGFQSHRDILPQVSPIFQHLDNKLSLYESHSNKLLFNKLNKIIPLKGNTLTASGFYGPQGRNVNVESTLHPIFENIKGMGKKCPITNLEMETAAIYGLAELFGHRALSINAILANRYTQVFTKNPDKIIDKMIMTVLQEMDNIAAL